MRSRQYYRQWILPLALQAAVVLLLTGCPEVMVGAENTETDACDVICGAIVALPCENVPDTAQECKEFCQLQQDPGAACSEAWAEVLDCVHDATEWSCNEAGNFKAGGDCAGKVSAWRSCKNAQ